MEDLLVSHEVSYSYSGAGDNPPVLSGFSLSVRQGEFFCLLGPSGCGKTSILNLLAGFTKPISGFITLSGCVISGPEADRGVVFQSDDALFPWLTAMENVAFGLKMRRMEKWVRQQRARDILKVVHLDGHEHKYPAEMSGGMKQRVQLARALVNDPKILLMDEPFGAVDAQTRVKLQDELVEIWQRTNKTIFFITHDITEAILLASRIGVVSRGPNSHLRRIIVNDLARPRRRSDPRFGEIWEDINTMLE